MNLSYTKHNIFELPPLYRPIFQNLDNTSFLYFKYFPTPKIFTDRVYFAFPYHPPPLIKIRMTIQVISSPKDLKRLTRAKSILAILKVPQWYHKFRMTRSVTVAVASEGIKKGGHARQDGARRTDDRFQEDDKYSRVSSYAQRGNTGGARGRCSTERKRGFST